MNIFRNVLVVPFIVAALAGCEQQVPERPDGQPKFQETKIYLLEGGEDSQPFTGTLVLERSGPAEWTVLRNVRFVETDAIKNWSGTARRDGADLTVIFDQEIRDEHPRAMYATNEFGLEGVFEMPGQAAVAESGVLLANSLSPEVKDEILNILRSVNSVIARARRHAEAGDWKAAGDAVGLAIGLKLHALYPIPGINVDGEGFLLPFYVVYREFSDIDDKIEDLTRDSNLLWGRDSGVLDLAPEGARERVEKRLEDCLQELEELISNLGDLSNELPWFEGDDAPDMLDDLVDALEAAKRKLENKQPLGTGPGSELERIRALKRNFLVEVSDPIPLWDAYELFREIDKHLDAALRDIRSGRVKGRYGRRILRRLELAEEIKHKLEGLIAGTEPDEEPRPLAPPRPEPPEPDYEPGQEDLPPFPPDDHA